MPPSANRRFLTRRKERTPVVRRTMTAAAAPVNMRDRAETKRLRMFRQGWQEEAWNLVDTLPELSYAYRFLGNASSRMRLFAAAVDPDDPNGPPIPLEHSNLDSQVKESAEAAMAALGRGRLALAPLLETLAWQFGVPGECFLVGSNEPGLDIETWEVRSIDEVNVTEDRVQVRDLPNDPQGSTGWRTLDPDNTFITRLWVPHPRFRLLANSPMRSLLDTCEELLLLSRDIRATARSRLSASGFLKFPEGLRVQTFNEDDETVEGDSTLARLTRAMTAPIADEGVAEAVVPILISGESEPLKDLDHLVIDRPYSSLAIELRAEAIGRIATGIDLPREVLEGVADINHWGAWQVADETFRSHIEPGVIKQVDALTSGFLRPWLAADYLDPAVIQQVVVWYDPVELVTAPDRTADALQLHSRLAISDAALRKTAGFTDEDAPDPVEIELRMVRNTRAFPPNVLEALFHVLDPQLQIPPMEKGTIPGMGPKGAIQPEAPPAEGVVPGVPAPVNPGPPSTNGTPPTPHAPGSTPPPLPPPPAAASVNGHHARLAARLANAPRHVRLSRRLAEIDAVLRTRLQTAACAAVMRTLERAGAKLRTRASQARFRSEAARQAITDVPNPLVASTLGPVVVAALGYADSHQLLNPDWSDLETQFRSWTSAAQRQALATAVQLAGLGVDDEPVRAARDALASSVDRGWDVMSTALTAITERLLYNPAPNAPDEVTVDPNTIVPMGVVRAAVAVAGGFDVGVPEDVTQLGDVTATIGAPLDQIGTSGTIGDLITGAGMDQVSYEWSHGPALNPFEPHEDLDGVTFSSFDDDALANPGDWPEVSYFLPGDHAGCSCDAVVIYAPAEDDGGDQSDQTADLSDQEGG